MLLWSRVGIRKMLMDFNIDLYLLHQKLICNRAASPIRHGSVENCHNSSTSRSLGSPNFVPIAAASSVKVWLLFFLSEHGIIIACLVVLFSTTF